MTRLITIATLLLVCTHAAADPIEVRSYTIVQEMGEVLCEAQGELDDVLFTLANSQAELEQYEAEVDRTVQQWGPDSNDAMIAEQRMQAAKGEALSNVVQTMNGMMPRFEERELENRRQVQRMLSNPERFEALTRGFLKGRQTPEVTALLVYLATRRVQDHAAHVYTKALLGELEVNLNALRESLDLVDQLVDPDLDSLDLESAWDDLMNPEYLRDLEGGENGVDDLDRLLGDLQ